MGGKGDQPQQFDTGRWTDTIQNAAHQQTVNNRPDVTTPWSHQEWTQNPDGSWAQNTQLTGGVGQAVGNIMGDLGNRPDMDWSQFGSVGTGDDARRQGYEAAYGLGERRLNDRFNQGRESLEVKLANQGLQPGTEAYDAAMKTFGQNENDAWAGLQDRSFLTGSQAGSQALRDNIGAQQQAISVALGAHNQPTQDLQALSGFLAPLGFTPDSATAGAAANAGQLGMAGQQQAWNQWESQQFNLADTLGALGSLGGAFLCDERAKVGIERLPTEALPGVPFALFRYEEGVGPPGLYLGVVAQDLQRVRPELVHVEPTTGYLMVSDKLVRKVSS